METNNNKYYDESNNKMLSSSNAFFWAGNRQQISYLVKPLYNYHLLSLVNQ